MEIKLIQFCWKNRFWYHHEFSISLQPVSYVGQNCDKKNEKKNNITNKQKRIEAHFKVFEEKKRCIEIKSY